MTQWNLSRLRLAVRRITGKLDQTQMPDSSNDALPINNTTNQPGIDDYINDAYLLDFPEELKLLNLKTYYTFNTVPNVGTYTLPQTFFNVMQPIYVDGYEMAYYQDPQVFYRLWPELKVIQNNIATGNNGIAYNFTLSSTPIQQGTVLIGTQNSASPSVPNENFTDADVNGTFTNPGVLTGSLGGTGTIDYLTGAVTINFLNAVATGVSINAHYYPYVASRPRDIMFYNQKFYLKPIPDDVYSIRLIGYQTPTVIMANGALNAAGQFGANTTDVPTFNEWWQMLAYAAALKIFIEDSDHEEYARHKVYFEEQKRYAQRRSLKQLATQRIQSLYADQVSGPTFPLYPLY